MLAYIPYMDPMGYIVQLSHGSLDPYRWIHGDVSPGAAEARRCSRPGHELRSAGVTELAPSGPRDAGHEKWWWFHHGDVPLFSIEVVVSCAIYIYTIYYNYNKWE